MSATQGDRPNLSTTPKYTSQKLPSNSSPDDESSGPSWGLIIPIIMIGVFLTGVVLCLWWHKWRDKRTLHIQRNSINGSAFQRSYRHSRTTRCGFDAVRDSTRSTTPLRSSINEKINNNSNNNVVKVSNVNVIPVQEPRLGGGKFAFHWDKNHWKAYPVPSLSGSGRLSSRPLSPIDEIDSPAKMSEISQNYDIKAQASFSPYHLTWATPAHKLHPHEMSGSFRDNAPVRHTYRSQMPSGDSSGHQPHPGFDPAAALNSPFFPNNNTPTTECETGSEASQRHSVRDHSSQFTSYPSSPKSTVRSDSHTALSLSTDTTHRTSYTTSHGQDTFYSSNDTSALHPSSTYPSRDTSHTHPSTNYSSLPSSIAQFSKQNVIEDLNNNSMLVPNSYLTYPMAKGLDYTLASSVASSDTHMTDNTSLLPNVGSSNTSSFPTALTSRPVSMEPSGQASPEDLSKLVDEMSSIRPVEDSSIRPNSSVDRSRIASISGNSVSEGLHASWSAVERRGSVNSVNTSSQNGSLYWDNYPLNTNDSGKSFSDHMHDSFMQHSHQYHHLNIPVLMETQYWV